ncbi:hypothetical protein RUND412_002120, partial [Rhizina undulata]
MRQYKSPRYKYKWTVFPRKKQEDKSLAAAVSPDHGRDSKDFTQPKKDFTVSPQSRTTTEHDAGDGKSIEVKIVRMARMSQQPGSHLGKTSMKRWNA